MEPSKPVPRLLPFKQLLLQPYTEKLLLNNAAICLTSPPVQGRTSKISSYGYSAAEADMSQSTSGSKPIWVKVYEELTDVLPEKLLDYASLLGGLGGSRSAKSTHYYFKYSYYNAGALSMYMKSKEGLKLNEAELKEFARQVSAQLNKLHMNNFVHGEVAPCHIMVNLNPSDINKPEYHLIGFGQNIKKMPGWYRKSAPELLPYLAPEVLSSGKVTPASDLWSLGILLYELASGNLPEVDSRTSYCEGEAHLIYNPSESLSESLNDLISKCLSADPEERGEVIDLCAHPFFIPVADSLNGYTMGKKLGEGKFSDVFACEKAGKTYAIKVLKPFDELDVRIRMMLLSEIRILFKIKDCPFAISLQDYFFYKNQMHLVLEHCNGGDLLSWMKAFQERKTGYSPNEFNQFKLHAYGIAAGLKEFHRKKIVHRDIKPDNILLLSSPRTGQQDYGCAKIADFGISRTIVYALRSMAGSPGYTAPEICSGEYNHKVDVWSFGVVLFNFLYRMLPCQVQPGEGHNYIVDRKIHKPKVDYKVDLELDKVIDACLQFDPEKRPEMRDVLRMKYFQEIEIPEKDLGHLVNRENLHTGKHLYILRNEDTAKKQFFKGYYVDAVYVKTYLTVFMKTIIELLFLSSPSTPHILPLSSFSYTSPHHHLSLLFSIPSDKLLYTLDNYLAMFNINFENNQLEIILLCQRIAFALREMHRRDFVHGALSLQAIQVFLTQEMAQTLMMGGQCADSQIRGMEIKLDYASGLMEQSWVEKRLKQVYGYDLDIRAFGIMMFQMIFGNPGVHKREYIDFEPLVSSAKTPSKKLKQAQELISSCLNSANSKSKIETIIGHKFFDE